MGKVGGTLFGDWATHSGLQFGWKYRLVQWRLRAAAVLSRVIRRPLITATQRSDSREVLSAFTTIVITVAVTVILFLRIFPWIITKLF